MNGVSRTHAARGVALAAIVALCLGIGSARAAHPAANGLIAFVRGGSIRTINSDGSGLSGPLVTGSNPAFSPDGTKIAYDDGTNLWTMNSDGSVQAVVPGFIPGTDPAWIDASTLVFTGPLPNTQIEKVPVTGGLVNVTPLTSNAFTNQNPTVSPSGTQVAFASNQTGSFEIFVMSTSGSGLLQVSGGPGFSNTDPSWSPDGAKIAYVSNRDVNKEIYSTLPTVTGADTRLTATAVDENAPSYSPDGSLIAVSTVGGIATFPATGTTLPTTPVPNTVAGDSAPDWQDAKATNLGLPTISPSTAPFVGGTISTSNGSWTAQSSNTYTYEWQRNGVAITPNGTGSSYIVQAADLFPAVLRVQVTATNIAGSTSVQSPPAGQVLPGWPVNFGAPLLSAAPPKAFPLGTQITGTAGTWTGVAPITFSFQWQWCDFLTPPQCEDIPAATSSAYAPSGDYINNKLRLKITAKNSVGSDIAYSSLSAPVQGDLPKNTISPKILAGAIEVGSTLTSDTGTFSGSTPLKYTYQWLKCLPVGQPCTPIPGATASSYVLQPSDQGATIRSQVTAANGGGSNYGVSNHTLPILPKTRFGPKNTDPPTLAGKPVVGSTLVGDPGTWTGEPPIKYTYTWLRCDATGQDCTAIPNAAGTLYKAKLADAGFTIKLLVTGRNVLGAATVNSDPTDVIVQLPPQPKGRKLTGTSKNDYLAGGGGNDTISGLGGNDTIKGGSGDDVLNGGDGNDVIDGGNGADRILGAKGSDTLFAVDGERDVIDCGPGVDRVYVDPIDVVKNCEVVTTPVAPAPLRRG
jgi:hypothetical protein